MDLEKTNYDVKYIISNFDDIVFDDFLVAKILHNNEDLFEKCAFLCMFSKQYIDNTLIQNDNLSNYEKTLYSYHSIYNNLFISGKRKDEIIDEEFILAMQRMIVEKPVNDFYFYINKEQIKNEKFWLLLVEYPYYESYKLRISKQIFDEFVPETLKKDIEFKEKMIKFCPDLINDDEFINDNECIKRNYEYVYEKIKKTFDKSFYEKLIDQYNVKMSILPKEFLNDLSIQKLSVIKNNGFDKFDEPCKYLFDLEFVKKWIDIIKKDSKYANIYLPISFDEGKTFIDDAVLELLIKFDEYYSLKKISYQKSISVVRTFGFKYNFKSKIKYAYLFKEHLNVFIQFLYYDFELIKLLDIPKLSIKELTALVSCIPDTYKYLYTAQHDINISSCTLVYNPINLKYVSEEVIKLY